MSQRALGRFAVLTIGLTLALLVGCAPPPPLDTPGPVELDGITIADFEGQIHSRKGKVVLIEVWFLGCAPCVKKFHQFVELHRELQAEGLVCLSLDIELAELKKKAEVLDFLKEKGADTPNFIVKDQGRNVDDWLELRKCRMTPTYLVFDRRGEQVRPPEPADKENMTRFLKKLLAEK